MKIDLALLNCSHVRKSLSFRTDLLQHHSVYECRFSPCVELHMLYVQLSREIKTFPDIYAATKLQCTHYFWSLHLPQTK